MLQNIVQYYLKWNTFLQAKEIWNFYIAIHFYSTFKYPISLSSQHSKQLFITSWKLQHSEFLAYSSDSKTFCSLIHFRRILPLVLLTSKLKLTEIRFNTVFENVLVKQRMFEKPDWNRMCRQLLQTKQTMNLVSSKLKSSIM